MNRRQFLRIGRNTPTANAAPSFKADGVRRNSNLTTRQQASRFLQQATFGPTLAEIDSVANSGITAWIDAQFAAPKTSTEAYMRNVVAKVYELEESSFLDVVPFRWSWWQAVMRGEDLLRQRVAMALSEIFVISTRTDALVDWALAVAYFYDLLLTHSFGNFRDLLYDVTLSPAMGNYLSHASNRKADPSRNRFPDENYAREVMQLFSIGLFELNVDGSRKRDASGEPIPTYNNDTIREFAKVFTGLTYPTSSWWADEGIDPNTEEGFAFAELVEDNGAAPMVMYEQFHEPGAKRLLNGFVVPAGQSGLQDVADAVDNLFNHANVGPFIGRLLIQRLVKSHPSPAYIERVAVAFNDNGNGVRGDMQAVVKAILLDDEARNTSFINDPTHGMLREPFVRYTQLARSFEARNEQGENLFYNEARHQEEQIGQYPFASPSVFNFFSPDYKPLGALADAGINAPEFQIMTSVSAVKLTHFYDEAVWHDYLMSTPEGSDDPIEKMPFVSEVRLNLDPYLAMDGDVNALFERMDLLLTYGSLSAETTAILKNTIHQYANAEDEWEDVVRFALILFLNCPEYAILK